MIGQMFHSMNEQYGHPLEWLELNPLPADTAENLRSWLDKQGRKAAKIIDTPKIVGTTAARPPADRPVLFSIHPRPAGGPAGYIVCQNFPNGDRDPVGVAYSLDAARTIIPPAHMAHPAWTHDLIIVHGDPDIGTVPITFRIPAERNLFMLAVALND